jgi:uncharacterized membrane protein
MGSGFTSLGWGERLERVLTYPLLWFSGLFFFLFEKNSNVRMHARQSMLVFGPLTIIWWIVGILGSLLGKVWLIGWLFTLVFSLLNWVFLWVVIGLAVWLIIMAWFKPDYKLPFLRQWL